MLTAVLEQPHTDVFPDRIGAIQLYSIRTLDLDDAETFQTFNTQNVAPDDAERTRRRGPLGLRSRIRENGIPPAVVI
jgi:hypothetical protein